MATGKVIIVMVIVVYLILRIKVFFFYIMTFTSMSIQVFLFIVHDISTAILSDGKRMILSIPDTYLYPGARAAVIHNSDYQSADDAKGAIDRYFTDRNR